MNFTLNSSRIVALAAVAAIGLSMANTAHAGRVVTQPTGDVSKAGGGCTVTAGSNKGKTGTYENDGGSLYCSGDGWSTGCVNQTGASSCQDSAKLTSTYTNRLPILKLGTFVFTR